MAVLMPAKRYPVEQIVAKLREHEKLRGLTIPQACKNLGSATRPSTGGGSARAH